jgi:hypothetical protein
VTDEIAPNPLENNNCDAVTDKKGDLVGGRVSGQPETQKTHSETYDNCIADDSISGLQDDAGPGQDDEAPAAGADEDRSCRQCDGPIDGTEQLYIIDDERVWLHPECHAHRLRDRGGGSP